jgi:hypothetical protein
MAINFRDPRYQRAQLTNLSRPPQVGSGSPSGRDDATITAFVGQQEEVAQRFSDIGLRDKMFKTRMSLARKEWQFRKRAFSQGLKDAKDANKMGMIGGLGTMLLAGAMGRQRRKTLEAETALRNRHTERLISLQEQHQNRLNAIEESVY